MAEETTSGHGGLYFIVGALVVVVAAVAFFVFGGDFGGTGDRKTDVRIEAPKAPPPKTQ